AGAGPERAGEVGDRAEVLLGMIGEDAPVQSGGGEFGIELQGLPVVAGRMVDLAERVEGQGPIVVALGAARQEGDAGGGSGGGLGGGGGGGGGGGPRGGCGAGRSRAPGRSWARSPGAGARGPAGTPRPPGASGRNGCTTGRGRSAPRPSSGQGTSGEGRPGV